MDDHDLQSLLADLQRGALTPDEAMAHLAHMPFADLGFARVDHHRRLRQGLPEAVYAPGKTPGQCASIVFELLESGSGPVLLTRADEQQVAATLRRCPGGECFPADAVEGRLRLLVWRPALGRDANVVVVTGGTADLPVAEECAATLSAYGFSPKLLVDCGVAGLHRLLACFDELARADAIVVIAGMEGAIASVVGGLVGAPVVAVPTSVGYGSSLEGITALLAMHASCAAGIVVVGIDNGYGAACAVARMLR